MDATVWLMRVPKGGCRGDVNHENNNCNHDDNNDDNNNDNNDDNNGDNNGDTNDDQMEGIAPAGKRTKNCLVWPLSIVALEALLP